MKAAPVAWSLLFLLLAAVPAAAAAVQEIDLPEGHRRPLNLAFDREGDLWFTLDGTWGVGRYRSADDRFDLAKIEAPKASPHDSLFGLAIAPDGSVWTNSQSHLHQVDPHTLNVTSRALAKPSQLTGGIWIDPDGHVWAALVSADRLVRLDPETGGVEEFPVEGERVGPTMFHARGGRVWMTATYAGSYATFDAETGRLAVGPRDLFAAPVGLASDAGGLWIAEHGANTLGRVDLEQGKVLHYPASRSQHHIFSGPNDVLVARDGAVWFVEHLGERIGRLDPQAGVLVEYELPSAPRSNALFLAEAPDGTIWYASWGKHKLGQVRFDDPGAPPALPSEIRVQQGGSGQIEIPSGYDTSGVPVLEMNATVRPGLLEIETGSAPKGAHLVLVSERQGDLLVGRYLTVHVADGPQDAPAPSVALLALLLGGSIAILRRGQRWT